MRPKLSESGPTTKVPMAIPPINVDKISCTWLGLFAVNFRAISGSAGSIASIEIATVATNIAISEINSGVEIRI